MTPATEALVERLDPTSALSRALLPPMILADALSQIQSDCVIAVGERRIHAENLLDEAATALRALSDRCDALIGFAAHDDDCTVNRYPGHDACSCGLSLILQQARHDPVSDPRQTVDPTIRKSRIVAQPPAGEE